MSALNPLNTILCEKCEGTGTIEGWREVNEIPCPVCDGNPTIDYGYVAELARQVDEAREDSKRLVWLSGPGKASLCHGDDRDEWRIAFDCPALGRFAREEGMLSVLRASIDAVRRSEL